MRFRQRSTDSPAVDMAPMIDAVFLLLIFFLVATMFKKQIKDIDIIPPESSSAIRVVPDDDTVVLGISQDGELFWEGQPSSRNQFHERLREIGVENPEQHIRLDADHRAPFRQVAEVLDMCRFRGLSNVGIRTYDDRYNQ